MRSRYSAFALKDVSYIESTMKGPAKKGFDKDSLAKDLENQEFVNLEVIKSIQKGNSGTVEFKAYFRIGSDGYCLHEKSEFVRENGSWYYCDGIAFKENQA